MIAFFLMIETSILSAFWRRTKTPEHNTAALEFARSYECTASGRPLITHCGCLSLARIDRSVCLERARPKDEGDSLVGVARQLCHPLHVASVPFRALTPSAGETLSWAGLGINTLIRSLMVLIGRGVAIGSSAPRYRRASMHSRPSADAAGHRYLVVPDCWRHITQSPKCWRPLVLSTVVPMFNPAVDWGRAHRSLNGHLRNESHRTGSRGLIICETITLLSPWIPGVDARQAIHHRKRPLVLTVFSVPPLPMPQAPAHFESNMALQVYSRLLILINVSNFRTATWATLNLSFVTVFEPHFDVPMWCVLDVQREELMRVAIICAILTGFACLMAGLVVAVSRSCFTPLMPNQSSRSRSSARGCRWALGRAYSWPAWNAKSCWLGPASGIERIVLGLISASGCLVGMLGEGQTIPLAVGTIATVGPFVGIACILPRTSRNADRRRGSAHRRGGT